VELKEMITYEHESDEIDKPLINMKVSLSKGDVFMVFEYAEYDLAGLINSSEVVSVTGLRTVIIDIYICIFSMICV